jgi:hypothetical protein
MVTKIVKQPLGMGNSFAPSRKGWIVAALGAATSIASSLIGGSQASKAAKEAERRQRRQEAQEEAWYNRRYNEDYIDTKAGQNLVRRAKDFAKENWKKASGAQAVAGGTAAATAMAKEAGNKMMGDTIANIGANDENRKMQADNLHRQAQNQFAQMDMAREMQRAQNITNAAQGASNAMMSIGSAVDQASTRSANLQGGSNNSKVVMPSATTDVIKQGVDAPTKPLNQYDPTLYDGLDMA